MSYNADNIRLGDAVSLITEKTELVALTTSSYISTDNMLPNFGGTQKANVLPRLKKVNVFQSGDILFSNIRTYFKKLWFADINGGCSADVLVFRPKNNTLDNRFLYYILQNEAFISYTVTTSKGTKMPRGDKKAILDYRFYKPNFSDQKKIAQILSTLDDKIELNKKINQTLESIAQDMFKSWFVSNPNTEKKILLGDLIQPRKGKNITKATVVKGEVPVVAGGLEPSCYHNRANTSSPVITISASGANAGFVRLYHSPVWSSDSSFIDESITPYVYFFYVFLKINQAALFEKQEGSAQPHIYPSHIMSLAIAITSENDIRRYEETVRPLFQKLRTIWSENCVLEKIRNTLLSKLLSGEIDVSNLNLEPKDD